MFSRFRRRRTAAPAASPSVAILPSCVAPSAETPGRTRVPSLATATRDYARALDAGLIDSLGAHEMTRLYLGMGGEIWAWQRARRLVGLPAWRAKPVLVESGEREAAATWMLQDIPMWERALAALEAEVVRARRYHMPPPAPLVVPPAVMAAIKAHRDAALERALRRRGRGDEGGGGPDLVPTAPTAGPPPGR